jgi:cellobiose phosphorylase
MYRLVVESLLGLRIAQGRLRVTPLLRPGWQGYRIGLRHGGSHYGIRVEVGAAGSAPEYRLDGAPLGEGVELVDDGESHELLVRVPPA